MTENEVKDLIDYWSAYIEVLTGRRWGSEMLSDHPEWRGGGGAIVGHSRGWRDRIQTEPI